MADKIEVIFKIPAAEFDRDEFADNAQIMECARVPANAVKSDVFETYYQVTETFGYDSGELWADNGGAPVELGHIVTSEHFLSMKAVD